MKRLSASCGLVKWTAVLVLFVSPLRAQNTLGTLLNTPQADQGFTLMAPMGSTETFLFDPCGQVVQSWQSEYRPGLAAYLMPDGNLIRSVKLPSEVFTGGGIGGGFELWDWDGNLLNQWNAADDSLHAHHDFAVLPNGNLLLIAWERHFAQEAIARGRNPEWTSPEVWVTRIEERNADDEVVWHWSVWDHLVQDFDPNAPNYATPSTAPGRIDINFNATALAGGSGPGGGELAAADWLHVNAIDYHPDLDQIVLSSRKFDEIWIIDHGLTSEAAAGPGGDLLYRWGNPQAYGRGTEGDRRFYGQHDVHWTGNQLMVFNNGAGRPEGAFSTVEEWTPPLLSDGTYALEGNAPFGPESVDWIYPEVGDLDFFSGNVSGAERLLNGNTLCCEGAKGRITEVTPDGNIVWEYINPMSGFGPLLQGFEPINNAVFMVHRYAPSFSGFTGRDMTPGAPIEFAPDLSNCSLYASVESPEPFGTLKLFPNPGEGQLHFPAPKGSQSSYAVFDAWGRWMDGGAWTGTFTLDASDWPSGHYVVHTFGNSREDMTRTQWMKS